MLLRPDTGRAGHHAGHLLGANLQRPVHPLEPRPDLPLQPIPQEKRQQAAEGIVLRESHPAGIEPFDGEPMLAIEQAGEQEPPAPAQFALRFAAHHLRAATHADPGFRFKLYSQARARACLALHPPDERVPARVVLEVRQFLPHLGGAGMNANLGSDLPLPEHVRFPP